MKKRNIMSTAIIGALLLMGMTQLISCTADGPTGGTSGEDGFVAEDTKTNDEVDNETGETETIDTNGEGIKEEPTESPKEGATMQEIIDRRYYLEQLLNDNYEVFSRIVSFFEEDPGEYFCRQEDGALVVFYNGLSPTGVRGPGKKVKLSSIEVGEELAYVMNELGFELINAERYTVYFDMVYYGSRINGSDYNQGILFGKSYAGEHMPRETKEDDHGAIGENIRIRDEWFRYVNYYDVDAPDNDIETEVPDTSVDDGGEEDTTSQTWTTIKEIEEMKERMICLLNENYDVFNRIVAYFEEEPEIIVFWEEDGEIVGRYEEARGLFQSIDLDEVDVGEDIAFVIDELGFVGIVDNVYIVDFYMVFNGIKTGGSTYDQDLGCYKSSYGEYGNQKDWEDPDNPFGLMHIRDEWYYYGKDHSRNNF